MRFLAALFLSALLAVMAYAIFWYVCINYTMSQVQEAVAQGLGADISYGHPAWVPDPNEVTMELSTVKMTMAQGPVREVEANSLFLSSGFLVRDRWRMAVPSRVMLVMANGRKLVLETQKAEVLWNKDKSLTLRADQVIVKDEQGVTLAAFDDVMISRKMSDQGVRLNLASRPRLNGVEGILSGEMVLPPKAFVKVLDLFGGELPGLGDILRTVATTLQRSGTGANMVEMENVSFKFGPVSGAVSGNLSVLGDGRLMGKIALTSDSRERVMGWVKKSEVAHPRSDMENAGMMRFYRSLAQKYPAVTFENMQQTLTMNGNPVGGLPMAVDIINRLWP